MPVFIMKPILLRIRQAAKLCNIAPKTWRAWYQLGKVPKPLKLGRLHFWRYDELVLWVGAGCPSRKNWDYQKEKKAEQAIAKPDAVKKRAGRGVTSNS